MMSEQRSDVTHDCTCPRCGRRLRQIRDLDWMSAASHRITCECGARLDVTVSYLYRVEAVDGATAGGQHEQRSDGR